MAEDQIPGDAPESAENNAAEETQETSNDIVDEVKDTAEEVKEGWNKMTDGQENKKMMAGILAIVLGAFGVHKFLLGYNKEGIIQLVLTFVTCGAAGIMGLIEGIIYLTKSDEEFYQTYQVEKKPWF